MSYFPRYILPSILYFATITRPLCCDILVDARRCRETRMWLVLRFSCARGGGEPGLDLAWGWRVGRNEGWAVYLRRRFSVFLPLAISRRSHNASQAHRFLREPRFSSHLSLRLLYPPSSGAFPENPWYPDAGRSSLSSRNNKLTLLNLSWAAFRSSSLRQQRAPAYLPTDIVTVFNSVIYLTLHAF